MSEPVANRIGTACTEDAGSLRLPNAVRAWGSEGFGRALKAEIESLDIQLLPLEQAMSRGGLVGDEAISAMVLTCTEDRRSILADVGLFFAEILAGCSCGDEPFSANTYCRLRFRIDKASARTQIDLIEQ